METSNLDPRIASQVADWLPTLEQRFHNILALLSIQLKNGFFHAPEQAHIAISAFVSDVKFRDVCARGDVETFDSLVTKLNQSLVPLRVVERPRRVA